MKIVVKKGLDIPIGGEPRGLPRHLPRPSQVALNLRRFETIGFRILVKVGQSVKIGQALIENKEIPGQMFVSPASGMIAEIRRGVKRRLLDIIIDVDEDEVYQDHPHPHLETASRDELVDLFMRGGILPHIQLRPFGLVPDPKLYPRSIFITAIETRPYIPPYNMQITGHEIYFQAGLKALAKMTTGKVHLVYPKGSSYPPFVEAAGVEKHTVCGPNPAGNASLHIHKIDPIKRADDYVWSLTALDLLVVGKMVLEGRYFIPRIISIAGTGLPEHQRGFFVARQGAPIKNFLVNDINEPCALISGDPLTGTLVDKNDFLGFNHTSFSVILKNIKREPFHFFRLGAKKYSATRTYLSGLRAHPEEGYLFTTNQHGEERAFIDPSIYDRVMPLRIPTVYLIKAILAEDFELAEQLGLLEVTPEDFALPTFICPSKINMVEIIKQGLHRYAKEMGH